MSYDVFGQDINAMVERVNALMSYETSVNYQYPIVYKPDINHLNNDVEGYNLEYYYLVSGGTYNKLSYNRCKLIPKEGVRLCGVLYDCKVYVNNVDTGETVKTLAVVGNGTSSTVGLTALYDVHETGATSQQGGRALDTDNNGRNIYSVGGTTQNWRTISFETIGESYTNIETSSDTVINGLVDSLTPNTANELKAVFMGVKNGVSHPFVGATTSTTRFINNLWFVDKKQHACAYTITKYPFPIFESDKIPQIVNYLNTGDDTGSIDPLDTNPKKKKIEDFSTNFNVYITPVGNLTRFSVQAVNNEYAQLDEDERSKYCEFVAFGTTEGGVIERSPVGSPNLTVTFAKEIKQVNPNLYVMTVALAEADETDIPFVGDHSNIYEIWFNYDGTKETNIHVAGVKRQDNDGHDIETLSRTGITDGYKFTSTTGDTVKVVFRGITINDLDDDYNDEEDTENSSTGTDVTVTTGSGYGTFKITDAQFDTINKKLWSTDWTNVFKSSTIDPIKCVIACKSIPFTASGGTLKDVIIANMNTGVSANAINPIKSFTVSATVIPSYSGDFTDITMLKVHMFLPFIGWVDLPATEVVSRVAYPEYGLSARTKTLGFKYLVDFVDGACRCIISVNGTERWYFDGNCAVDIPVTSDNHTQAVANAVRSGLGATLSFAGAVGGAMSGNGMLVAMGLGESVQGALGAFPVYNYSATSSPSGYINASMNNHIMIVIERPNVQRPEGYAHSVGLPCMRRLPLGSLSGFTKCANVDTTGINGTPNEIAFIKGALESGVYL